MMTFYIYIYIRVHIHTQTYIYIYNGDAIHSSGSSGT